MSNVHKIKKYSQEKEKNKLEILIQEFLEYCEIEKNKSQHTIKNYDHYLRRFADWSKIGDPKEINLDLVRKYRLFLNRKVQKNNKPLKKITQNYHIVALRSFLKYLAKKDIKTLASEKVELPKASERVVEFLTAEELEKLLSQPKTDNIRGVRDKAILEMLFSTGLRVSELVSLNRTQINPEKDEFSVKGKGDKIRIVFLSKTAQFWLRKYIYLRSDNQTPLFINHSQKEDPQNLNIGRLSARGIQRLIRKYALSAGLTKKVTPHTLRHSFATDLLSNNANIRSVQMMLGHANLSTTQIYTHVTNQELKEIHQKYHDRKRKSG